MRHKAQVELNRYYLMPYALRRVAPPEIRAYHRDTPALHDSRGLQRPEIKPRCSYLNYTMPSALFFITA